MKEATLDKGEQKMTDQATPLQRKRIKYHRLAKKQIEQAAANLDRARELPPNNVMTDLERAAADLLRCINSGLSWPGYTTVIQGQAAHFVCVLQERERLDNPIDSATAASGFSEWRDGQEGWPG